MKYSEEDKSLQKNLKLLMKYISEKKLQFNESLKDSISPSLRKVEYNKHGEIDLNTVDPLIRALSSMVAGMDHHEKLKEKISLSEIQAFYFELLDVNFGHDYREMLKYKVGPHEYTYTITRNERSVKELIAPLKEFLNLLESFWKDNAESAYAHMSVLKGHKFVYGGDFFPQERENIASKCGIYADSIILPCPYMRSRNSFQFWSDQNKAYYLLKFALNILKYKDAATLDLKIPIVAIIPGKEMLGQANFDYVQEQGERDSLVHSSHVFNKDFQSLKELLDFCKEFDNPEKIMQQIVNSDRVLFDLDLKDPLIDQIKNNMAGNFDKLSKIPNAGILIGQLPLGRMINNNELLLKSAMVGGTPMMDAPTSWKYFQWKLEYDVLRSKPISNPRDLHIVHGINQLSSTKLEWLGNIPIKGLIELRKNDALYEIREILNKGINDLATEDPLNFTKTSHKVFNNLNHAFRDHEKKIKELKRKKWKIAGMDIGLWMVSGSIEIAAAATGIPVFGLSSLALTHLTDAPKLKDLPKSLKEYKATEIKMEDLRKRSPVGILISNKLK